MEEKTIEELVKDSDYWELAKDWQLIGEHSSEYADFAIYDAGDKEAIILLADGGSNIYYEEKNR